MGNVSRKVETLRKNQKKIAEINNTVAETKNNNAFDGLRLVIVKERIRELENNTFSKLKIEQKMKKKKPYKNKTKTTGYNRSIIEIAEREEREKLPDKNIAVIVAVKFPQLMVDIKLKELRENQTGTTLKSLLIYISYSNCRNQRQ